MKKPSEIEESLTRSEYKPLITDAESSQIESRGGAYCGFVDTASGQVFREFWVDRRAFYDTKRRAIVDYFLATEAIGDAGSSDLEGPEDVFAYDVLLVRRSVDGSELASPCTVRIQRLNPDGVPVGVVREHAQQVHNYVLANMTSRDDADLKIGVQSVLAALTPA